MKKIYKDKILNIEGSDSFDNTFLFEYMLPSSQESSPPTPLQERGVEHDDLYGSLVQANHRLPYNKSLSEARKELKQNLTFHEKKFWTEICKPLQDIYKTRILQQRII
jgi:hypothetical protein